VDLNTVTELVRAAELTSWRSGDAWLAGGTVLFSTPPVGLIRLLDLTTLGWAPLTVHDDGLEIAATCTVAELLDFARSGAPPTWVGFTELAERCCHSFVASFKIWNVATVGGNLCTALPAGPMISLTAALDGVCLILTPDGGRRHVPVLEFVTGDGTTALSPGEVLRSVHLPVSALTARTAFRQGSLYPLGRSAALLIGRRDPAGALALTVTASTVRPYRVRSAAGLDDIPTAAYVDDVHGLPVWRRHLTARFAAQLETELRTPR